ncbi:PsiF family protein [Piscinibacter koreensis]|uniref:PsiF repeat-containing protein n=1 Tax=Piscinibacter koreensis TaxID=2742824 RepID=A0A7Y6TV01_9BURK|nr:hypothetical protein [Schlegelella koreensis]
MKALTTLVVACSLALAAAGAPAAPAKTAADGAPPAAKPVDGAARPTQQNKMKTCNADAKGKKGDERKAFMKECLSR